jgi:nucleoside-diphosphate-sugar epimerase
LANDARMWLWHDVNTCYTSNLLVNTNVFQAARMAGVKRIVFASSIQAISGSRTACDRLPSPLPYLPIDGKTPANPSNFYGLGKAASEQLLRAVCEWSELTGMALRLPAVWIRSRMYHQWLIRSTPRSSIKDSIPIDECLAWISDHDACGLITACLKADVTPGYHCYLPAGRGKYVDIPWDRIVADHFRGVELRADPEKLDCLVDIRSITDEIGWEPQDTIEAWLKEVEALSE